MLKLVLASRNQKKIRELETFLSEISSDIKILSLDDIGFTGEIEETGSTFAENSKIKAEVPASLGYIGVADDSGLEVDALGGAPGVYSARYSGFSGSRAEVDAHNNEKLLHELRGTPDEMRTARFRTVITCAFPDGTSFQVNGTCEGKILREPDGDGGFGYDPLFYYEPFKKTFAALTPDEKNSVSHRGKAMRSFAEELKKRRESAQLN